MNSTTPANPTNQQPNPPATPPPPAQPTQPITRYFYKELFSNAWYIGGKPVDFEQLEGNRGVIALLENDPLVPALDQAAHDQVGGIVKISADEYAKKKSHYPLQARKQDTLQIAPRQDQSPKKTGKAFQPLAPQGSPESPAVLVDQNPGEMPPISGAAGAMPIGAPGPNDPPQRPPDQPDFKSGSSTPKFVPKTARAGTGKAPEPSPV